MKVFTIMLALLAFAFTAPATAQTQETDLTCQDIEDKLGLEPTEEALERFKELRGSCEGVVMRDGKLFVMTRAVVRRASGRSVRLYLPATDHTFSVDVDPTETFELRGGRNVRARDLNRGQELRIYVSVDRFTQPIITEMALSETSEEVPVTVVEALPTTG
jgi:hypothetical protein